MSDAESTRPPRRPYRRAYNSGTWHFSEHCPAWPLRDFVESENADFSKLCMDCHRLLTRNPDGSGSRGASRTMQNALPPDGTCPTCSGSFHLQARTLYQSMTPGAHDKLEWKCAKCGRAEVEHRRATDGVDDEWPASRFQRR